MNSHYKKSKYRVKFGKLITLNNIESEYIESTQVDVWLPPSYNENIKYSTLYMHDGQMLFDSSQTWNKQSWEFDLEINKLINENKILNTIIIAIHSNTLSRHSTMFPSKPMSYLTSKQRNDLINESRKLKEYHLFHNGILSDEYLKFIVYEVKPIIDSLFSVKTNNLNTFIGGSSMGGLISLYAMCEYPNIFSKAMCLSTHWPGTFPKQNKDIPNSFIEYLKNHLPNPIKKQFYFDYGTEELDAVYAETQLSVDKVFNMLGYKDVNYKALRFNGANHSEKAWANRLAIPLLWILSNIE